MIKHGGTIIWSASDLTLAAGCEHGFLRALDRKLGRAPAVTLESDPLQDQIAELGNVHERRVLADFRTKFGAPRPGSGVIEIARAKDATADALSALVAVTKAAFAQEPDLVFQAGFFDGEFHGYADFIRRTDQGWVVADAKISLGIEGIKDTKKQRTVFGIGVPGAGDKAYLRYAFQAKLGIDGAQVRVTNTGEDSYTISVPEFRFIGYSEPTFEMAVEDGGPLKFLTPDIDKVEMVNEILSESEQEEYITSYTRELQEQTEFFYTSLLRSIEAELELKFEFA